MIPEPKSRPNPRPNPYRRVEKVARKVTVIVAVTLSLMVVSGAVVNLYGRWGWMAVLVIPLAVLIVVVITLAYGLACWLSRWWRGKRQDWDIRNRG